MTAAGRRRHLLPGSLVLVGLLIAVSTVAVFVDMRRSLHESSAALSQLHAERTLEAVELHVRTRLEAFERLAERMLEFGTAQPGVWEAESTIYLRDFPELAGLIWRNEGEIRVALRADSDGEIERILRSAAGVPAAASGDRHHLALTETIDGRPLLLASTGFEARGDLLAVALRTDVLADRLLPSLAPEYDLTLEVEEIEIVDRLRALDPPPPISHGRDIGGLRWQVTVWPPKEPFDHRAWLAVVVLSSGLLAAILVPGLFGLAIRSRRLQAEAERALAAEQELHQKLQRLQHDLERFFEVSVDLLCVAGSDGYFKLLSQSWTEVLGWSREELLSTPFVEFVHPDDREATARAAERLDREIDQIIDFENRYRTKDGEYRWLRWRSASDPHFGRIYAIARDVTVEKERERELEEAREELAAYARDLERSNAELEQFAYVASHDLQEPLRMVASYVTLLEQRYGEALDQDAKEFIGFAVDGARRMQQLIDDLLAYSRIETQGREAESVSVVDCLEQARRNLDRYLTEENALVTHDELPEVMADPGQLTLLLQNLIHNAVKFARNDAPPRIHVAAELCDDGWEISVADNGIGIDPNHGERIFQIFQRLHGRKEYPGTGIGLALCRRIVERHGGTIRVESEPGNGSTFYFTLPRSVETDDERA